MIQKNVGFWYASSKKKNCRHTWLKVVLCLFIIIVIFCCIKFSPKALTFENEKVSIVKWNNISKFYEKLDKNQILWLKFYIKRNPEALPNIQEWTYIFSGTYTNAEFLAHIAEGPEKEYISYTVLEWWSIYDIDADLAQKWYISAGEYIDYVTNPSKIAELSQRYDFFDSSLKSLEWFLYPDTYYLDNRGNLINQLVSIQLNTFQSKIWSGLAPDFVSIQSKYGLSVYETITLASIVEKEEKNNSNKTTVAWIFYNRLQAKMLIGADITLCYGLAQPYSACSPTVITNNLNDASNKYNTRALAWLTPTPIWNPSLATIQAVLHPNQTNYYFYLHDSKGEIHYAETNAQHNDNKAKYL